MALEPAIAELVNDFIAAGRPSLRSQRYLGVVHGFFQLGGISQTARNVMRDIALHISSSDKP